MNKSEEKKLINSSRSAFFLAGYGISTLAPLIPILQERYALDPHELGLLLLCSGIGGFSSMPLAGWLVGRIGCRNMVYCAVALMATALFSITLSPIVYLTGALLFFVGMAGVSFGVVVNINAAHVERMIGRSIMSSQHGIYSIGCICGTLAVTCLLGAGLSEAPAEAGALCLYILVPMVFSRRLLTRAQIAQHTKPAGSSSSAKEKSSMLSALHPVIICIGLMCFVMYQTEGSMMDWSGVFLKNELHAAVEQAGFGYAAFSVAMTCFRLLGDKIVTACGRRRVLVCGTVGIFFGYCFVVFGGSIYTALLGYFIIGLGAANLVPQLISFSATIEGVSVNRAVTTVNAIGCLGSLLGPATIGFCANLFGLGHTFLMQGCLVLCVGAGCLWLLRNKKPPVGAAPKSLPDKKGTGEETAPAAAPAPAAAAAH